MFARRVLGDVIYGGATMTISWVDDRVAIGDIADVTMREGLRKSGIDVIVDVRLHFAEYIPKGQTHPDMYPLESIWDFANFILEASEKHKILIHCHGGIDRSPFVAMLYYKLKHGCDYEEAYNHIQKIRPQCIVHDEWVRLVETW
jgi:predicted protein tyrosine phosphatase